jgi:hypothetical protein
MDNIDTSVRASALFHTVSSNADRLSRNSSGISFEELPEGCIGHLKAKHAVWTLRATPNRAHETI